MTTRGPTFNDLVEVKDEEKDKEYIFDVITPSQPVRDWGEQGEDHREVELIPGTLIDGIGQFCFSRDFQIIRKLGYGCRGWWWERRSGCNRAI